MFIYILRSILFQGIDQKRVVVTNFPIKDKQLLEQLVNHDNSYGSEKGWRLSEIECS